MYTLKWDPTHTSTHSLSHSDVLNRRRESAKGYAVKIASVSSCVRWEYNSLFVSACMQVFLTSCYLTKKETLRVLTMNWAVDGHRVRKHLKWCFKSTVESYIRFGCEQNNWNRQAYTVWTCKVLITVYLIQYNSGKVWKVNFQISHQHSDFFAGLCEQSNNSFYSVC